MSELQMSQKHAEWGALEALNPGFRFSGGGTWKVYIKGLGFRALDLGSRV